jgi:hypothetical protein
MVGDPTVGATFGINAGTVYNQMDNLRSSVDDQTVTGIATSKRKAFLLDGSQKTLSNEFADAPLWIGRSYLAGYQNALLRADGYGLSDYWRLYIWDTLEDTARMGPYVADAIRKFGVGNIKAQMVYPRPRQILGTWTCLDSSYTDSTEINTAKYGGGLLEAYVSTAITVNSPTGCTLRLKVYGKNYSGSTISDTVRIPYDKFGAANKISIGALGRYYADVTSVTLLSWVGYSAITAGTVQIRTRRDRDVRK